MNRNQSNRGFTLVELLVVITIISLLAAFGFTKIMGARVEANKVASQERLGQIYSHLLRYEAKKKRLPSAAGSEFVLSVWGSPYIEKSFNNSDVFFCASLARPELTDEEIEEDGMTGANIHWAGRNQGERGMKIGRTTVKGASKKIIACNKPLVDGEMPHRGESLAVLYASGQTRTIDRDAFGEDWGEDEILVIGPDSPVEALQALAGDPDDEHPGF